MALVFDFITYFLLLAHVELHRSVTLPGTYIGTPRHFEFKMKTYLVTLWANMLLIFSVVESKDSRSL